MRIAPLLLLVSLSGCTLGGSSPVPSVPDDEARHRAALATVVVENLTALPLRVSYRTATPPIQEVQLASIPARGRLSLPPVPAGEPLLLLARREDGTELALGPRSFSIDENWTWQIPADAVFKKN